MRAVKATGRRHGWILIEGRPRVIPAGLADADFVLFAGLPGFEGAQAVAEVISGAVNPSGRIAFSYPQFTSHITTNDHKPTDMTTSRWDFGHGLSYTTFEYSSLRLDKTEFSRGDLVTATVTITNTGSCAARHSVLWYISDAIGSIPRPVKQLKHYESVVLAPGESKTLSFRIEPNRQLVFPDANGTPLLENISYPSSLNEKSPVDRSIGLFHCASSEARLRLVRGYASRKLLNTVCKIPPLRK